MQELSFEQVDVVSGGSKINDSRRRQAEREQKANELNTDGGTTMTSSICITKGPTTTCVQSDGSITTSTCFGPSANVGGVGFGSVVCMNTSTPAAPGSPKTGSVGDYWGVP